MSNSNIFDLIICQVKRCDCLCLTMRNEYVWTMNSVLDYIAMLLLNVVLHQIQFDYSISWVLSKSQHSLSLQQQDIDFLDFQFCSMQRRVCEVSVSNICERRMKIENVLCWFVELWVDIVVHHLQFDSTRDSVQWVQCCPKELQQDVVFLHKWFDLLQDPMWELSRNIHKIRWNDIDETYCIGS